MRSFLLILFFASAAWGQTGSIDGMVLDNTTNNPLIGVNIQILNTKTGAATDASGRFKISRIPIGTYRLQFQYIGYEPVIKTDVVISSGRPEFLKVGMQESYIELESITIKPSYFSKEPEKTTSLTKLSREEIRRFPGGFEDVVRTVATLPGVSVVTDGGRNDLLVRGGGPTENLYLVNGIEVPNINHFGGQGSTSGALSFVNLDFIENVEFSTGGFGARYGNKMSSVLSIDLRPGRRDHFGGKATISATQFGLNLEGPVTSSGTFLFSARKSYLDLIFKAVGQPFIPVYTDFNFLLTYDLSPQNKLTLLSLAAIDRVDRDQSTFENRVKNSDLLDNSQDQIITGVSFKHLMKKSYYTLTANINHNRFRLSQVDSLESEFFNSSADETELNLKAEAFFEISRPTVLRFGANRKQILNKNTTTFADSVYDRSGQKIPVDEIGANQNLSIDQSVGQWGLYAEWQQALSNQLDFNLGVRLDSYGFLEKSLYPAIRFASTVRATESLKFKGSYGIYTQAPSYVWTVNPANRNLKALRNSMVILGIDYLLRDDTNLSFEGYYKKYSDLPTGVITGVTDYLVLTNTGVSYGGSKDDFQSFGYFDLVSKAEGKAYGLELAIQKKYSDIPLYGQLSLGYGKSEYTAFNGKTYPGQFDQRLIFNFSGGYKFNEKWEVSGKFRVFTGAPFTPVYNPSENNGDIQNLPDEYLAERLRTGHHLDLRLDRRFNFSRWTMILFADIQNIYNYKIQVKPRYELCEDEIEDTNAIGLLPSIGISAEW